MSPYAFGRLAARPLVIAGWLWALWLTVPHALFAIPDGTGTAWMAMEPAAWPAAIWIAFWRVVIALPGATGFVAGMVAADLHKGLFSWSLPDGRPRLLAGLAMTGLLISAPTAGFIALHGDLLAAAAAYAVSLTAFAAACALTRGISSALALGMVAGLITLWKRADVVATAIADQPVAAIAMATAATMALYAVAYSHNAFRRTVDRSFAAWAIGREPGWMRYLGRDQPWRLSLHNARALDWVRAAHREVFNSAYGLVVTVGVTVATFWLFQVVVPAFVLGSGFAVTMILWMSCALQPMQLRRGTAYPISRRRRTAIAWLGGVISVTAVLTAGIVWSYAVYGLGQLVNPAFPGLDMQVLIEIREAIAWYPVVLWTTIRYGDGALSQRDPRSVRAFQLSEFVRMMAAFVITLALAGLTKGALRLLPTGGPRLAGLLLLAIAIQAAFFLALRRYFATGDLR